MSSARRALVTKNVFECLESARGLFLPQPERRFLTNRWARMCLHQLNENRNRACVTALRDAKDSFLSRFRLGIVVNGLSQNGSSSFPGALGNPEECMSANLPVPVIARKADQLVG